MKEENEKSSDQEAKATNILENLIELFLTLRELEWKKSKKGSSFDDTSQHLYDEAVGNLVAEAKELLVNFQLISKDSRSLIIFFFKKYLGDHHRLDVQMADSESDIIGLLEEQISGLQKMLTDFSYDDESKQISLDVLSLDHPIANLILLAEVKRIVLDYEYSGSLSNNRLEATFTLDESGDGSRIGVLTINRNS